jgi:hypothetical protein
MAKKKSLKITYFSSYFQSLKNLRHFTTKKNITLGKLAKIKVSSQALIFFLHHQIIFLNEKTEGT